MVTLVAVGMASAFLRSASWTSSRRIIASSIKASPVCTLRS
jgi:hypothetical protein